MRWFKRWYGANPLHLLVMVGCFALAWYAGEGLLHVKTVGVVVWFAGAVIGHDLVLMPLYAVADRSVLAVFKHRPPKLPTVPWINYLRVPVMLSGLLLLMWFPLIFRIPSRFPQTTDLSLNPYLGHWLAVTGALFLLSAVVLAIRLRPGQRQPDARLPDPPAPRTAEYPTLDDWPERLPDEFDWPQRPRAGQDWRDWEGSSAQPRGNRADWPRQVSDQGGWRRAGDPEDRRGWRSPPGQPLSPRPGRHRQRPGED